MHGCRANLFYTPLRHGDIVARPVPIACDEGPTLETLDFTIRVGSSTPTVLYSDCALFFSLEIPDVPRTNDVFICYSSKNKTWVCETLRRNLDAEKFQTKVDKDFEPGVDIHENVINAIYGSRKTIFVLSKDSLKSYKARTNLRQALVAGRTGHEVIVILYEKCKVPVEIRNKQIYLDWTDEGHREMFWDKLYRAIRRPLRDENQSAV